MSATALSPVVIQVRFDRVYGNVLCYPVNDAAKLLATIAGTRTLSRQTMRSARLLGLEIQHPAVTDEMLREWTA